MESYSIFLILNIRIIIPHIRYRSHCVTSKAIGLAHADFTNLSMGEVVQILEKTRRPANSLDVLGAAFRTGVERSVPSAVKADVQLEVEAKVWDALLRRIADQIDQCVGVFHGASLNST